MVNNLFEPLWNEGPMIPERLVDLCMPQNDANVNESNGDDDESSDDNITDTESDSDIDISSNEDGF